MPSAGWNTIRITSTAWRKPALRIRSARSKRHAGGISATYRIGHSADRNSTGTPGKYFRQLPIAPNLLPSGIKLILQVCLKKIMPYITNYFTSPLHLVLPAVHRSEVNQEDKMLWQILKIATLRNKKPTVITIMACQLLTNTKQNLSKSSTWGLLRNKSIKLRKDNFTYCI